MSIYKKLLTFILIFSPIISGCSSSSHKEGIIPFSNKRLSTLENKLIKAKNRYEKLDRLNNYEKSIDLENKISQLEIDLGIARFLEAQYVNTMEDELGWFGNIGSSGYSSRILVDNNKKIYRVSTNFSMNALRYDYGTLNKTVKIRNGNKVLWKYSKNKSILCNYVTEKLRGEGYRTKPIRKCYRKLESKYSFIPRPARYNDFKILTTEYWKDVPEKVLKKGFVKL